MNILRQTLGKIKKWILYVVSISILKLQLRLSRTLNKFGVPNVVAKILTKVHHKDKYYSHQYNKGCCKYLMMLY